jgi:hypothetical protein
MPLDFISYKSGGLQRNYIVTSIHGIILYFLTRQVNCNEFTLFRVFMALHVFQIMSGGFQRNCIITSSHVISIYFLTSQVDCNEIISLRVVMALDFISFHLRWIATKLYYDG